MRTAPEGRDSRLRPSKRVCEVRINRIDSNVFFVAVSARRTRCPKVELRRESLVTNPSLRFQESTMAVAIRTGDKTAQTAGVCGRDLEIELKPASAVLAARSIHHALSAIASGVILLS